QWAGTKQPNQPTVMHLGFLDGSDSYCLRPFGPLPDLELNTLVFLERAIAASLNLGVVDEKVLRAVVRGDEAKALLTVEPFHGSLCHLLTSLIQMRMYQKRPRGHASMSWPSIENNCGAVPISVVFGRIGGHACGGRNPSGVAATEPPPSVREPGRAPGHRPPH